MTKGKDKSGRLSVFKGREARLNRAIFHILALKGPLTIYDIHRQIRTQKGLRYTHYGNVNKRVRALHCIGYVRESRHKRTKAGFETVEYELTMRTFLALILDAVNLEDSISRMDQDVAREILAAIVTLK